MNTKKIERQQAAQLAAAKRVGKKALTLSFAMLRADALFAKFEEEMSVAVQRKQSEDDARSEAVEATKRMENTPFSAADALRQFTLGPSTQSSRNGKNGNSPTLLSTSSSRTRPTSSYWRTIVMWFFTLTTMTTKT